MSGDAPSSIVSVLIPVSSRAPHVYDLHKELVPRLEELDVDFEVLYLLGTDCSDTAPEVRRAQAERPGQVRVLQFAATTGEAAMLSAGIEQSSGDVLLTLPARFECELSVLNLLYEAVREGSDLAFASRKRGSSGASARVQSQVFNWFVSRVVGSRFKDVASGTRAIRREVVEEIPVYGDFHRYLPVLAQRAGFQVREIPGDQHSRAAAPFVYRPLIYLWRLIDILSVLFISRFTRYPLRLFGGIGAAFLAAGSAILLVIVFQRVTGTPLAGRPMLVLGTLLVGLGVQVFAIGLLSELIVFFHARSIRDHRVRGVYEGGAALPARQEAEGTGSSPG